MNELDARLHRIGQHYFRTKLRLRGRDRAVVDLRGIATVRRHAEELVERRQTEHDEKVEQLRALIAEADAELDRGEFIECGPTLFAEILEEALEANRRGEPVDEHVKG